jgi:hypothetical protein
MPGFLYYIPNGTAAFGPAEIKNHGLAYALAHPSVREVRGGPDGGDGVIVAEDGRVSPGDHGFFKDRQEWRKIPGSPAWVGMFTGRQPVPEDLARSKQLPGHWVTLLDGQAWHCPAAKRWIEQEGELRWLCPLPQRARLGEDGRWQSGDVIPQYAAVWGLARRWEAMRVSAPIETTDGQNARQVFAFDDLLTGAVQALAVNYAIGPAEVDLLGLLSDETAVKILDALSDIPTRIAWQKKSADAAPAGTTTGPGSAG